MSGRKLKKKSLKQRRKTLTKDPFIMLQSLVAFSQKYYDELETGCTPQIPTNGGKTMVFRRYPIMRVNPE